MKKQHLLTLAVLLLYLPNAIFAQIVGANNANNAITELAVLPSKNSNNSEDFKKIAHKMYDSEIFLPAKVDSFDETIFLRYNIYKDQIEFNKNNLVVFLKKQKGRDIFFTKTKEKMKVFEFDNELKYFTVHNSGENILLSRRIVEYSELKKAATSYEKDRPADLKRKKDEIYIKFSDDSIVELPSNKKKFYRVFGKNEGKIKKYIKKNKLNIKEIIDLKQIVNYYNSI